MTHDRRTRTQVPTLPRLLEPVVDHNVHDKLLINKERQAINNNKGAKDFAELKRGDTVRLIPPRSLTTSKLGWRNRWELGCTKWSLRMVPGSTEPSSFKENKRVLQQKHVDL